MFKTIYKYELDGTHLQKSTDPIILNVPFKAHAVLSVKEQFGKIVAYILVDEKVKEKNYFNFYVYPTGKRIHEPIEGISSTVSRCAKFVDTVKFGSSGDLMFHVFYSGPVKG